MCQMQHKSPAKWEVDNATHYGLTAHTLAHMYTLSHLTAAAPISIGKLLLSIFIVFIIRPIHL